MTPSRSRAREGSSRIDAPPFNSWHGRFGRHRFPILRPLERNAAERDRNSRDRRPSRNRASVARLSETAPDALDRRSYRKTGSRDELPLDAIDPAHGVLVVPFTVHATTTSAHCEKEQRTEAEEPSRLPIEFQSEDAPVTRRQRCLRAADSSQSSRSKRVLSSVATSRCR